MQFPKHKAGLLLEHNDHLNVYETVAGYVESGQDYYAPENWVSPEQMEKAIAANDMWTLHWYPETPVGFCVLHAADLEVLMAAALADDTP